MSVGKEVTFVVENPFCTARSSLQHTMTSEQRAEYSAITFELGRQILESRKQFGNIVTVLSRRKI
ncbi:MAG: hypothetical protein A2868_01410 [Candidatus Levybacteria bacterium RIFCSPHIGHO2_01_FULL_40_15b]|nr:MAG: hypothetical protein A2868_01410 [Candidatus Levybacteria bacterium RIFCSPHIGHO2_01_FULL_40_15b]